MHVYWIGWWFHLRYEVIYLRTLKTNVRHCPLCLLCVLCRLTFTSQQHLTQLTTSSMKDFLLLSQKNYHFPLAFFLPQWSLLLSLCYWLFLPLAESNLIPLLFSKWSPSMALNTIYVPDAFLSIFWPWPLPRTPDIYSATYLISLHLHKDIYMADLLFIFLRCWFFSCPVLNPPFRVLIM